MKRNILNTLALLSICLNLPVFAQTQNASVATDATAAAAKAAAPTFGGIESYIPWILVITAVALGIVILFMGSLLSKVAIMKIQKNAKAIAILMLSTAAFSLNAATETKFGWSVTTHQLNYMLLGVIFFEVLIILYFAYWLKVIVLPESEKVASKEKTMTNSWWDKFNNSVKIEDEKDASFRQKKRTVKYRNC